MMDYLECMQSFIEVAKQKSFTKAAKKLGTSGPTVTKRIQFLELKLGITLLKRTTRNILLTEEGVAFHDNCQALLEEWDNLLLKHYPKNKELTGTLRIGALSYLQEACVIPVIDNFTTQHPKMNIEIYEINEEINLNEDNLDIFIGINEWIKTPASTKATKLTSSHRHCYASPTYLEKYGAPQTPEELNEHKCVIMPQRKIWQLNDMAITPNYSISTDSIKLLINAGRNGLGIINLSAFFIEDSLREGLLIPILHEYSSDEINVYAYYLQQAFVPEKITSFLTYMKNHIAQNEIANTTFSIPTFNR